MSIRRGDFKTMPLFEEGDPRLPEGHKFDEKGNIVAPDGKVFDENMNLLKEAPSEGLLRARKIHPDWSDNELSELAQIINRELKNKKS